MIRCAPETIGHPAPSRRIFRQDTSAGTLDIFVQIPGIFSDNRYHSRSQAPQKCCPFPAILLHGSTVNAKCHAADHLYIFARQQFSSFVAILLPYSEHMRAPTIPHSFWHPAWHPCRKSHMAAVRSVQLIRICAAIGDQLHIFARNRSHARFRFPFRLSSRY